MVCTGGYTRAAPSTLDEPHGRPLLVYMRGAQGTPKIKTRHHHLIRLLGCEMLHMPSCRCVVLPIVSCRALHRMLNHNVLSQPLPYIFGCIAITYKQFLRLRYRQQLDVDVKPCAPHMLCIPAQTQPPRTPSPAPHAHTRTHTHTHAPTHINGFCGAVVHQQHSVAQCIDAVPRGADPWRHESHRAQRAHTAMRRPL